MRKLLLILFCIVLGVAAYYAWNRHDSTLNFKKDLFALKNPESITEVHISSGDNEIRLMRKNGIWYAGNVKAEEQLVSNLMMIATHIEAMAPVSFEKMKSMLGNDPRKTGIRFLSKQRDVLIYDLYESNNVVYAGKPEDDIFYRISVKGLSGVDIAGLFTVSNSIWQSHVVIDVLPKDIRTIQISYPSIPANNFSIESLSDGEREVIPRYKPNMEYIVDQDVLNAYLFSFRNIEKLPVPAETLSVGTPREQIFSLKIITFPGDTIDLKGYRKEDDIIHKIDPDIFFGLMDSDDYILLKYSDFDPILVSWDYFLKK